MAMMRGGVVARVAPMMMGTSELQISAVRRAFEVARSRLTLPATGHETEDPGAGLGQRHHDRDRVVGGGVGVDEESAHGACLSSKLMSFGL
jgi:hypothetical protein